MGNSQSSTQPVPQLEEIMQALGSATAQDFEHVFGHTSHMPIVGASEGETQVDGRENEVGFGAQLHAYVCSVSPTGVVDAKSLSSALHSLLSDDTKTTHEAFWRLLLNGHKTWHWGVRVAYELAVVAFGLNYVPLSERSMQAALGTTSTSDHTKMARHTGTHMPWLFAGAQHYIVQRCWSLQPSTLPPWLKALPFAVGVFGGSSNVLLPADTWLLSCLLPPIYTGRETHTRAQAPEEGSSTFVWELLYNSTEHGLSLNRLRHHVFGYAGPTFLLVADTQGNVCGAAVDVIWDDGGERWGGQECRVFNLLPAVTVVAPPTQPKNTAQTKGIGGMYVNDKGRHNSHGVGAGWDGRRHRLWLDQDLSKGWECVGGGVQRDFGVRMVEVWGCGGERAARDQAQHRAWKEAERQRREKSKRLEAWDDDPDKALLEMAGVTVNHAQQ